MDLENVTFEQFQKFMENKEIIFAKPNVGESGKGIEKLSKKDFKDLKEMFDYITNKYNNKSYIFIAFVVLLFIFYMFRALF